MYEDMEEPARHEDDRNMSDIEDDLCLLTGVQISSGTESSDSTSEDEDTDREDSQRQLQEFAELSQQWLAELAVLEAEYEHQGTGSRQQEDAARVSVQILPVLTELPPDVQPPVTEEPEICDLNTDPSDLEPPQPITELQETFRKLVEEKKEITAELGELKSQTRRLNKEIEAERLERKSLSEQLQKSQRKFFKLNRVSLAVSHEYAGMLDELEMEQNLRQEAEICAHKMLREQKAVTRQSMILMQNIEPNKMLMKALEEVRSLTATLEETKQDLQTKVTCLELQLSERPSQEEFLVIQEHMDRVNTEKLRLEEQLKVEQEKSAFLEEKVKSLEEELKEKETPCSTQDDISVASPAPPPLSPTPPPPPPPPCSASKTPEDPLALIRWRRGLRGSECPPVTACPDVRADALRQIKERIENGVTLRPVRNYAQRQSTVTKKRRSVINELQAMLKDNMKKPARKASRRRVNCKVKESELESVLLRRRRIVDIPLHDDGNKEAQKPTEKRDGGNNVL